VRAVLNNQIFLSTTPVYIFYILQQFYKIPSLPDHLHKSNTCSLEPQGLLAPVLHLEDYNNKMGPTCYLPYCRLTGDGDSCSPFIANRLVDKDQLLNLWPA